MKLGINSYSLMWAIGFKGVNPAFPESEARPEHPLTPFGLLEKAHAYGLHLVQTGPNLQFDSLSRFEQDTLIQQALAWEITLELGTRGLDRAHLREQIALAKRMDAKLIRTLPELDGIAVRDARQMIPAVAQILPEFERAGLQLAVENGRIPAAELRSVLDEIDSPHFGVVLDMVNSLAVPEGWKDVTRILAPHTMCLHYKDFTIRRAWHMMGFICEGAPSGQGMVDTPWLLDQLRVSPYDYNVLVELWPPEQNTLAETIALEQSWLDQSIAYLRQFIPG